jgi:hypothetical protein
MTPPFISKAKIRKYAAEARAEYERRIGRPLRYPLPLEDIFPNLFGLDVVYDTEGRLNALDDGIIGCLFPDGHQSPWGMDKIIAVNLTATMGFNPGIYGQQHTIAHEGLGHYVLHFLKGVGAQKQDRPRYCRTDDRKDSMEWQADFAAGEFTQPEDKVAWLLDSKRPPEIINVEVYAANYLEFFGSTRSGMEVRLKALGYRMVNTRNAWAGPVVRPTRRYRPLEPWKNFDEKWPRCLFPIRAIDFRGEGSATAAHPAVPRKVRVTTPVPHPKDFRACSP